MLKNQLPSLNKLQFNAQKTNLKEAKKLVCIDIQESIPFLVWLTENPQSPIALPGKISLDNHDCIHVILGLGVSLADEALILGLTMGNDTNTKEWQVKLFKFISSYLYPKKFRFRPEDFYLFDLGLKLGRQLPVKNLNKIDFTLYEKVTIAELRNWFGIDNILPLLNLDSTETMPETPLKQLLLL
ncbi:hypothetical protein PCC7424_4351 [Gloeothece citriformis PCC 7424]|uniref:Uncharacterized protein n=1 Tax=Gloeothece citriformis (strain PCC 7424) TaxID=65393 RepID=B7K718_GLOC7|nr:hypothetical protein [Gloeothece citriformis]ACK72717.1 hypothetical protein PCC7424_4351 [Gloeothece citriformis PCC 7424]